MARSKRNIKPGLPNHIITRGNNRRRLFSYPRDYLAFLRFLFFAMREFECRLHAACLMTNHAHLLLTPPTVEAASNCMKLCQQRYAQLRNGERNSSGKLFEQRFFSAPIRDEKQLAATTTYIEANPIRAGMTKDALEYRWSTYATHIGHFETAAAKAFKGLWTPTHWYEQLGADASSRAQEYREQFDLFLRNGTKPQHAKLFSEIEALSASRYRHRLRRPDESRASEPGLPRLAADAEKPS